MNQIKYFVCIYEDVELDNGTIIPTTRYEKEITKYESYKIEEMLEKWKQ